MVSIQFKVLILLEIHPTIAKAVFWVRPNSHDSCWTPQLLVQSRQLSSELACANFCIQKNCDSYHFSNGLCELSHLSTTEMRPVFFRPYKKKGETREVARKKLVQASPQYSQHNKDNAVDGITTTLYHSADETPQPWILVDLQSNVWVTKIRILLFTSEGFHYRTKDIQILVGTAPPPTELDFSRYTEVGLIKEPLAPEASWQEFEVTSPKCTRYVVVKKQVEHDYDQNLILLYELEVLASF